MKFIITDKNNKTKIFIDEKPENYGVIYVEYSEKRIEYIYKIDYYYKNIFQNSAYEISYDKAEKRLKNILIKINNDEILSFDLY